MAQGQNWKHGKYIPMAKVTCKDGLLYWANPSKVGTYRCTKCGLEHR